jgi:hypothetical protein
MINFLTVFNINTTIQHFLDLFPEFYLPVDGDFWRIDRPQRGKLLIPRLVDETDAPDIVMPGNNVWMYDQTTLEHPMYYFANLRQKVTGGYSEPVPELAYEMTIEEIAPQQLHVALLIFAGLVVTDFLAATITKRLSSRFPDCRIQNDYSEWVNSSLNPDLIPQLMQKFSERLELTDTGEILLRERKPWNPKSIENETHKVEKNHPKRHWDAYSSKPQRSQPLADWFLYRQEMTKMRYRYTLKELADDYGCTYQHVKNEHARWNKSQDLT